MNEWSLEFANLFDMRKVKKTLSFWDVTDASLYILVHWVLDIFGCSIYLFFSFLFFVIHLCIQFYLLVVRAHAPFNSMEILQSGGGGFNNPPPHIWLSFRCYECIDTVFLNYLFIHSMAYKQSYSHNYVSCVYLLIFMKVFFRFSTVR